MGLDISLRVDNDDEILTPEYFGQKYQHALSREFCNLMCRPDVIDHTPELDQIGEITNTDISLLYKMTEYPSPDEEFEMIDFAETEEEKERLKSGFEKRKLVVQGNIKDINSLVEKLISNLNTIDDLYDRLIKTDFDSLNSQYYFSDFTKDKGEGYIRNNFGQDLRNFKRFIDFAIERNSKTVWFEFG